MSQKEKVYCVLAWLAVVAMIGADCGTNATSFCHNLCPGPRQPHHHHHQQQPCPGLGYFRTMLVPMLELGRSRFQLSPSAGSPLVAWSVVPSSAVSWRQLSATSCYHQAGHCLDTGRLKGIGVKGGRDSTSCSLLCPHYVL